MNSLMKHSNTAISSDPLLHQVLSSYYAVRCLDSIQNTSVRASPKSPKADGLACPEIDGYNDHKKSTERKMPLKDARFAG